MAAKMDAFFSAKFLPAIQALVATGLSYDEVKRLVKILSTWDAKISGNQVLERTQRHENA